MKNIVVIMLLFFCAQFAHAWRGSDEAVYHFRDLKINKNMLVVDKYSGSLVSGRMQSYYSNGNVEISVELKNGVRGKVYFYNEQGDLMDEGVYRADGSIDYSYADNTKYRVDVSGGKPMNISEYGYETEDTLNAETITVISEPKLNDLKREDVAPIEVLSF